MEHLGTDDARRIALWSAGLLSGEPTPAAAAKASARRQVGVVRDMLGALGAVQLDTISVLARSHELIAYARYGAVRRAAVEEAYWSGDAAFEYWSHAACVLPMSSWPLFAFRRRHYRAKGERWHGVPRHDLDALRGTIRDQGPVTTGDVGGAKRGGEWWDWSDSKIGLEWLLDVGEVVVTRRVGWRRTYDLAERAVPGELLHDDLDDAACERALVAAAAQLMGVGTAGDIADVHRLPKAAVTRHAEDLGLVPVTVPGWPKAWATPEALGWAAAGGRDRHRTTLLSPFDPLVWYRERVERIFGMRHRIEAYTPAHKRVHGYFAMPVLHRGRLVARVDPGREAGALVARRVTIEPSGRASGSTARGAGSSRAGADGVTSAAIEGTARGLLEAATWVGAERVELGEVVPASAAAPLRAALGTP